MTKAEKMKSTKTKPKMKTTSRGAAGPKPAEGSPSHGDPIPRPTSADDRDAANEIDADDKIDVDDEVDGAARSRRRREVTISVCMPVTLRLIVRPDDDDPEEGGIWTIDEVVRADVDVPSDRFVMECMSEEDARELDRRANAAQDLQDGRR